MTGAATGFLRRGLAAPERGKYTHQEQRVLFTASRVVDAINVYLRQRQARASLLSLLMLQLDGV